MLIFRTKRAFVLFLFLLKKSSYELEVALRFINLNVVGVCFLSWSSLNVSVLAVAHFIWSAQALLFQENKMPLYDLDVYNKFTDY